MTPGLVGPPELVEAGRDVHVHEAWSPGAAAAAG
jgi:hypothetical protein